ncbi:unnamed protein product, partial [marine sediment metagenome]
MADLKNCPFCGSNDVGSYVVNNGGDCPPKDFIDEWTVSCNGCIAEGPWGDSKENAEELWNTRKNEFKWEDYLNIVTVEDGT